MNLKLLLATFFCTITLVGCYNTDRINYSEIESYSDFEIEQARIEYAIYKYKHDEIVKSSNHCVSQITVYAVKSAPEAIEKCIEFGYITNGVAYKGKEGYTKTFLSSQLLTTKEKGKK